MAEAKSRDVCKLPDNDQADDPCCIGESPYLRQARMHPVVQLLHKGKFGRVYRLANVRSGAHYAYKLSIPKSEEDHLEIHYELRALAVLHGHPNIVPLLDFQLCPLTRQAGFTFEMWGHSLEEVLEDAVLYTVFIPNQRIIRVMSQLLRGLGFIHSKGVVHFDIKPGNLLVTSAGRLKICGFGASRFMGRGPVSLPEITPGFGAPECYLGYAPKGRKVDMWSTGAVFYYLMTFRCVEIDSKDNDSLAALAKSGGVVNGLPNPGPHLQELVELGVPSSAKELANLLLHYDPKKRPSVAEALQHEYFQPK